jgi:hypothetical protein
MNIEMWPIGRVVPYEKNPPINGGAADLSRRRRERTEPRATKRRRSPRRIRPYLDDLDRGRFVMRPSLLCGSCEFRERHCQAWDGS